MARSTQQAAGRILKAAESGGERLERELTLATEPGRVAAAGDSGEQERSEALAAVAGAMLGGVAFQDVHLGLLRHLAVRRGEGGNCRQRWRQAGYGCGNAAGRRGLGLAAGDGFDFDLNVSGEAGGFDGGTCRGVLGEVAPIDLVHGGEIAHVLEEDGGFEDVVE